MSARPKQASRLFSYSDRANVTTGSRSLPYPGVLGRCRILTRNGLVVDLPLQTSADNVTQRSLSGALLHFDP